MSQLSNELSTSDLALARSRTYELLSSLFLFGLSRELHPVLVDIPELAATLPTPFDVDEAAAEHHTLFGFNVFPYQSIFLDPAGLLGGTESARVQASYARSGFSPTTSDAGPDHMGHELAALAFLCGAEADAWEDNLPQTAARVQQLQTDFMSAHLLRWFAPFTAAIARQASPFFAAVAGLTLAVLTDHAAGMLSVITPAPSFSLPSAPDLLTDDEAGLHDIAEYLLAPPLSGLFLARADLERLGRRFDLPRGFGERRQLLVNLLRAAGTYDRFPALCTELAALAAIDGQRYAVIGREHPTLDSWIQPWSDHIQQAVIQLEQLAGRATSIS